MLAEFFSVKRDILSIAPTYVGSLGGINISNSTLYGLLLILIVVLAVIQVRQFSSSANPSKFQIFVEWAYESIHTLIRQVAGSDAMTNIVFPVTGSIFVFILLSNLLSAVPGIGAITVDGVSLFRTTTGDVNTTIPLALLSVLLVHAYTIKYKGIRGVLDNVLHLSEITDSFKKGFKGIGGVLMGVFMALLDLVGELAKVLSLSMRLFGNLFASDVLMTILLGILSIGIPALWLGLGLLSAIVQTIVFTSLVTIFFSLSLSGALKSSGEST